MRVGSPINVPGLNEILNTLISYGNKIQSILTTMKLFFCTQSTLTLYDGLHITITKQNGISHIKH